jgi:uncharacterized protein (DUF779 family)
MTLTTGKLRVVYRRPACGFARMPLKRPAGGLQSAIFNRTGKAMTAKLTGTPQAIEMLQRLTAERGPLAIFQSGGCCDGTSPICLLEGELPPGGNDLLLGELGSTPFYVDREQYDRWGRPAFLIDVGPGPAQGFSLSLPDSHLVTRTPAGAPSE